MRRDYVRNLKCVRTRKGRVSRAGKGIKVNDINFKNEKIFFGRTKSGDEPTLYLSEDAELFRDLKKYIDKHGLAGDDYRLSLV